MKTRFEWFENLAARIGTSAQIIRWNFRYRRKGRPCILKLAFEILRATLLPPSFYAIRIKRRTPECDMMSSPLTTSVTTSSATEVASTTIAPVKAKLVLTLTETTLTTKSLATTLSSSSRPTTLNTLHSSEHS